MRSTYSDGTVSFHMVPKLNSHINYLLCTWYGPLTNRIDTFHTHVVDRHVFIAVTVIIPELNCKIV